MEDVPQGERLVPAAIDFRAQATPDRIFAFLPKGDSLQDGFSPLTYAALARAIDETAWWLDEMLGGKATGSEFPAIPYIGDNDFRYNLLTVAAMKTKRKIMVFLLYNTVEASIKLLKASCCGFVMASRSRKGFWDAPREQMPHLQLIEVPDVTHFIHDKPVKNYPYNRSFEEGLDDPQFVMQTSGTTGYAKALNYNNRAGAYLMELGSASTSEHQLMIPALIRDAYCPNLLPLSWSAGLVMTSLFAISYGSISIMLPTSSPQPMTPEYVSEVAKYVPRGKKNGIVFVPDVLRETANRFPDSLKHYDWVGYAGAPLDHTTGDKVSQWARVQSLMGATETGIYPFLLNDPADWKIHRFHPTLHGFYFEHFADDLHELCIKRQPQDPRPCFLMDPHCEVYHSKDLWRPVAGREGFWSTAGRVDDFVKLSTMTKFNAIEIEQILDRNPDIEKSLVAGDARLTPFAIVQLANASHLDLSREGQLDRIASALGEANRVITSEARLARALILLTDQERPIKRTSKGTMDRRNTISMYQGQIDEMYENAGYKSLQSGVHGEA